MDQAYNQGGAGKGRTIHANDGAVEIRGPDGLVVEGRVGVGTTAPVTALDVVGGAQVLGFRMPRGAVNGYVLTADSDGIGSWQPPPSCIGDITSVVAGDGLLGGGDAGEVTLHVGAGEGILVTQNAVLLDTVHTNGLYVNEGQNNSITSDMIVDGTVQTADLAFAVPDGHSLDAADGGPKNALYVNNEGKVGIGTLAPEEYLHVVASSRSAVIAVQRSSADAGWCGIQLKGVNETWTMYMPTNSDELIWRAGYATHMRLTPDGKLGLGTSPAQKLDVAGTVQMTGFKMPSGAANGYVLTSDANGVGTWQAAANSGIGGSGSSNYLAKFATATTIANSVIYESNSNIGIGTAFPNFKLTVQGDICAQGHADVIATKNLLGSQLVLTDAINLTGITDIRTASLGNNVTVNIHNPGSGKANLYVEGDLGVGTFSITNILTVQRNSATDPIADAWTTYSSARWKENIHTLQGALKKVSHLRGVSFEWRENGKRDIGLIAEEVGQVVPEVVTFEDNCMDAKAIDYGRLVALLIEAIKEQQQQIEGLLTTVKSFQNNP